jgi:predicted site-specific integrase-resolvase
MGGGGTMSDDRQQRPTLIPGPLAAQEVGVAPATIRKWVQLGHLKPAGKAGRAQLFRLEDVFAAERAARGTNRRVR